MKRTFAVAALSLSTFFAGQSLAAFDLQITEIWPGNEPGSNLTEDWFEVTNFGDMAWTDADGTLFFDDDSADAAAADPMSGITSIAPGESVIYVNNPDTLADWLAVWGSPAGVQVGQHDGSGLGQGGDGVALFLTMDAMPSGSDLIDFEEYPDADFNGGQSYDVVLGEFSTIGNASGAFQSTIANDENQYGIGSPGSVGNVVPEPASLALLGLGAGLMAARRRRSA